MQEYKMYQFNVTLSSPLECYFASCTNATLKANGMLLNGFSMLDSSVLSAFAFLAFFSQLCSSPFTFNILHSRYTKRKTILKSNHMGTVHAAE